MPTCPYICGVRALTRPCCFSRAACIIDRTWSVSTPAVPNSDENERAFPSSADRPVRSSPTVPPRPVPWLPMAMADLTRAVGIASRRARAQGSQPPSLVGVVGWCKHLALHFFDISSCCGLAHGMGWKLCTETHVERAQFASFGLVMSCGRRDS